MSFTLNTGPVIGQPFAPLSIKTGGRDIVATGTVITGEKANLEFQLAHLRVFFSFVSDGGQPRLGPSSASGSTLNLTLFNFDTIDGFIIAGLIVQVLLLFKPSLTQIGILVKMVMIVHVNTE